MSAGRRSRQRRELVLRWQQPIYNYVRRMVADESLALDLTQDVFVRVFEHQDRVDPARFQAWVYRVATNLVYQHLRNRRRRQEKERAPVLREPDPAVETELERREIEAHVKRHLDELPLESRSLLYLHYFNGLSHREIADALELPRTTVTSRLRRALESLRTGIGDSRALLGAVPLESFLASTPPLEVPARLSDGLLALSSSVGPGGVSSGLTLGGIVMTQKLVLGVLLIASLALISGFSIGRGTSPSAGNASDSDLERALADARQALDTVRDQQTRLDTDLRQTREQRDALSRRLKEEIARRQHLEADPATPSAPADPVASDPVDPLDIDWERLAALTAEHADTLFALADAIRSGRGPRGLSPEQQADHRGFIAELDKVAAQARLVAPYPVLDEELFPQIVDVHLGVLLELDDEQRAQIEDLGLAHLRELELHEDLTPLEAHRFRQELLGTMRDEIVPLLDDDQRDAFDRLKPIWSAFSVGNQRRIDLGIDRGDVQQLVLEEWTTHYHLTDDQQGESHRVVERYLDEARTILDRHGDLAGRPPAARAALDADLHRLQVRYEKEILPLLTPEQRRNLPTQVPVLLGFSRGGSMSISSTVNAGF